MESNKPLIGRPRLDTAIEKFRQYNDTKQSKKQLKQEMEKQEKIQKIDELRKNIVGFIISKSEAGELVIFFPN